MARDGEDLGVLPSQEWGKGGRGRRGRWLEMGRTLEYYHLKSGVREVKGEREGRVEEKG